MSFSNAIPGLYRSCLKTLLPLKQIDPSIHTKITNSLHKNIPNFKAHPKQAISTLQSLSQLLKKSINGEEKSIIKTVRIFTNSSMYLNDEIQWRSSYETRAVEFLKKDLEFEGLDTKEQEYVMKIVAKICDKKPTYKYKSIGEFLASASSERDEVNNGHIEKAKSELKIWREKSGWVWAYDHILGGEGEDKIEGIIEEMIKRNIVII